MGASYTQRELAEITCAELSESVADVSFTGAEFDSRRLKAGNLFVALKGETAHGEQFLDQAFANGAALALVENRDLLLTSAHKSRLLAVADSTEAFIALGAAYRQRISGSVLGVTGSMGKTTVKEMAAQILSVCGQGSYSLKSFNNHWGVPYTLCNTEESAPWVVLEMGMNHPGELAMLSEAAQPDAVLITGIAPVHIEFFGSVDAIADAKCEIFTGSPELAIVNGDDKILLQGLARRRSKFGADWRETKFGVGRENNFVLKDYASRGLAGCEFTVSVSGKEYRAALPVPARHQALLASAAIAAAVTLFPDVDPQLFVDRLKSFTPPPMRLNIFRTADGRTIIDDSYNANLVAMKASIELAAELAGSSHWGVVLGDMRELGKFGEQYHREIGSFLARLKPSFVQTVGDLSRFIGVEASAAGIPTEHFSSPLLAGEALCQKEFSLALIKASRGVELDRCVKKVREILGESS